MLRINVQLNMDKKIGEAKILNNWRLESRKLARNRKRGRNVEPPSTKIVKAEDLKCGKI